jgi:pimeloyl-ACP methyl ester carboxylesterase
VTRVLTDTGALRTAHGGALAAGALAGAWTVAHLRSPMVRCWRPGAGRRTRAGPLAVRTFGDGDHTSVLLHGLTASGDVFGAGWDALGRHGRVVVPDLLGFGRSLGDGTGEHGLDAHLRALEDALRALTPPASRSTVIGHSLGALLALHLAARSAQVERVVAISPPLYRGPAEADARIGALGPVERTFALDTRAARLTCRWMCRHRDVAQWLVVAARPRWPVSISRAGVRHTWGAYLGAMDEVIRSGSWSRPLEDLAARGTPVALLDGALDPVLVPGRAAEVAREHGTVTAVTHPTADHELPVTHPAWCLGHVGPAAERAW